MRPATLFDYLNTDCDITASYESQQSDITPAFMPRARRSDPSTSKRAAARMAPAAPALEAQILDLLARHRGGLIKDQVCLQLRVDPRRWPSVASALSRLKGEGKLKWPGAEFAGQKVWTLVEQTVDVGDVL